MLMNWCVVACRRVGLLTHAYYSELDSTISMKVGGVNGLGKRKVTDFGKYGNNDNNGW